jgi:K+-sensing histidine kinase KdpD
MSNGTWHEGTPGAWFNSCRVAVGKGIRLRWPGLALTKALVEAMNGDLSARNRPEGGATFALQLPFGIGAE